ncbi:Autophagy-related protein 36 [Meyerozyma sp. JA9]|nr:Autophagy-related protein 36 [Meyerozyma sp. JA9]
MEECTICLEGILPHADLGVVSGCRHHYHEHCLLQWCSHSNSCPSCRQLFNAVFVVDQQTGSVKRRVVIQNKILFTDSIENIPSEYVNPPAPPEDEDIPTGVCSLCSSSDVRASAAPMMKCNSCFAGFHLRCLGISNVRDTGMDPTWCCPMCDVSQDVVISQPSLLSHRSHRVRNWRPTSIAPASSVSPPRRRSSSEGPGPNFSPASERSGRLIIHNENGELDDSFLYADAPHTQSRPMSLNGGVLSRRETRQWQNLSPEEIQSWNMFHQARQGAEQEYPQPSTTSGPRRKRRRRRDGNDTSIAAASTQTLENSRAPTLVRPSFSSIMNQVRNGSAHPQIPHSSPPRSANHSPPGNSPMDGTGNGDSDSQSDADTRTFHQKPALTFDQKTMIQKHIRNYLRPLYRPGDTHSRISNEEDYIRINKSVSRKVYSYVLSLSSPENGTIHVTFINDYLHDQTSLKQTVDRFVEEELRLANK